MQTRIPITKINLEGHDCHILIEIVVNKQVARMLVDTGASKTVFDYNRINRFTDTAEFELNEGLSTGLGTNSMQSHTVKLKNLYLGSLHLRRYNAVLLDMNIINESYTKIGLEPIDGVLGGDILLKYKGVISYKTMKLGLWK